MSRQNLLYVELLGGESLNVQDLINGSNNSDKTLERLNIVCNTTNGLPIAIALPDISNLSGFTNLEITIDDKNGNASVGNIVVTRAGTNKVNNGTSATINTNFGKLFLQIASVGTTGGWTAFSTATSAPYVPPSQANDIGVLSGANTFQLTNFPVLATQHVIVTLGDPLASGTLVRRLGTDYTINYATGLITFLVGAPADITNVFYSY